MKYVVTHREVRDPESGKLLRQGETFEAKTERGRAQADVQVRVGRMVYAPESKPVRQVQSTKPHGYHTRQETAEPAPEPKSETVEPMTTDDAPALAPKRAYTRRDMKAED